MAFPFSLTPPCFQVLLKEIQDSLALSGEVVQETVTSIETVRSFATEKEESERYQRALAKTCSLKNRRDIERALYLLFRRVSCMLQVGSWTRCHCEYLPALGFFERAADL